MIGEMFDFTLGMRSAYISIPFAQFVAVPHIICIRVH